MTALKFTYAATRLPDGRHEVHLYIEKQAPTWDLSPGGERKAVKDADKIVRDLIRENDVNDPARLLKTGKPAKDDTVVCHCFVIVGWDRKLRLPTYRRGDYMRTAWDAKWNPVAKLMMEQQDYILSVLKKRLRDDTKRKTKAKENNDE